MIYGPDGGVYLLDWSDIGECHENDGIHRTSGRIFKITYGEAERQEDFDITKWSDEQLVDCKRNDNQWFVRHARKILHERFFTGNDMTVAKGMLQSFIQKQIWKRDADPVFDSRPLLRAVWALHSIGGTDESFLLGLADFEDEHIRAWVVRLLAEEKNLSQVAKIKLTEMAANDSSGLVRLYIASALNRFDLDSDYEIYKALLRHQSDQSDRIQPHLIWNRIEPHVLPNWEKAIELILDSKFPQIRENIARRVVSEIDSRPGITNELVALLSNSQLEIIRDVSRGMKLGLEGRTKVNKPTDWDKTIANVMESEVDSIRRSKLLDSIKADLKKLSVIFGDGQEIADLRKIAIDKKASIASRRMAIEEYAATRPDDLFKFLKSMVH